MAPEPELEIHADEATLAGAVAARCLAALAAAQAEKGRAVLALTAGSVMQAVWQALATSPDRDTVSWAGVDVFWADERFVPADSGDRNDGPANRILFDRPPFFEARQFPAPASDGDQPDLDAAALAYSAELAAAVRPSDGDTAVPAFDVVLLGLGPDGHCASLFPHHPGTMDESHPVIAVRNSPKPPPERLSFSFDTLNAAEEIWFVASGTGKADAVGWAHSETDRTKIPSSGVKGRRRTVWFLDQDAAAKLP
ncbi:MAG TPA: 6-phosphogluconolactonase [Jatrophihabitans sp.]|nr:6-phosphogluconolactonase [Jatrophihabitans sp.]